MVISRYVTRPDEYLSPVIKVSEAYDAWLMGSLRQSKAVIEMSWEQWPQLRPFKRTLHGTCIVALSIWRGDETLFEFELGACTRRPHPSIQHELALIVQMLQDKDMSTLPPRRITHVEPSPPKASDAELRRALSMRAPIRMRHHMGKRGRGSVPIKMPMGGRNSPGHR